MSNKHAKAVLLDDGRNLEDVNPDLYWENEAIRERLELVNEEDFKIRQAFENSQPRQIAAARFTMFRDLSAELRDMVWDEAVSSSGRVVEFTFSTTNRRTRFYSKTGVPAIMMVNHEARKRALTVYNLLDFGKLSGTTYINWKADTVLFKKDALEVLMTEITEDHQKGRSALILESDNIAARAAKSTVHQQINRNCRELAVQMSDLRVLKYSFVSATHFPGLRRLAYISRFNEIYEKEEFEGESEGESEGETKGTDNRLALLLKDTKHIETEDTSNLPAELQDKLRFLKLNHPQLQCVSIVEAFRTEVKLLTGPEKEMRKRVRTLEAKERIKHAKRMARMGAGLIAPSMKAIHNVTENLVNGEDEEDEEDNEDGDQVFLGGEGEGGEDGEFFDEDALVRE